MLLVLVLVLTLLPPLLTALVSQQRLRHRVR